MRWHDRAIHRHHRQIQITGSRMDKTFKKIRLGPTPEPFEDTGPPPKMRREITPGGSCPEPPENPFQTKTIVHRRAPRVGHLARTQRGHPRPHLICQNCAICILLVTHLVCSCRLFRRAMPAKIHDKNSRRKAIVNGP